MRAASLFILCAALLSLNVSPVKAEQQDSGSLGRRSGPSQRASPLQLISQSWAGQAILEDGIRSEAVQGKPLQSTLNSHSEGGQGKARQQSAREARQLLGASSSSSSSSSRSSSSFSSSSSSGASSASSASRSSSGGSSSGSAYRSYPGSSSSGNSASGYSGSSGASSASKPASASGSGSNFAGSSTSGAQGATQQRTSYVPPSYKGPTTTSASGALTVSNRLTTGYPATGLSTTIPHGARPAASLGPRIHYQQRPYTHTYPSGYTLIFIPYYSPNYSGHHWAVYNSNNNFYGFDDGDTTSGGYDYEDDHELPAGCEYSDSNLSEALEAIQRIARSSRLSITAQPPSLTGAHGSAMPAATAPVQAPAPGPYTGKSSGAIIRPGYIAPAPAPDRCPRNVEIALASQDASPSSSSAQLQGRPRATLLCKPIAAAKVDPWAPPDANSYKTTIIILSIVIPVAVFTIVFVGVWYYLRRNRK